MDDEKCALKMSEKIAPMTQVAGVIEHECGTRKDCYGYSSYLKQGYNEVLGVFS